MHKMLQPNTSGSKLTKKDNTAVKCSLLYRQVQSRVSYWPGTLTKFCDNLLYLKCMYPSPHPQISQVCSGKCQKEIQSGYSHGSHSKDHLVIQYSPHQWAFQRLQKIIDYIVDYYILLGSGESRYEVSLVWCLSIQEACSAIGMLSPWLPDIQFKVR